MADRWGVSKNVLTLSLRKNAKNKNKKPNKGQTNSSKSAVQIGQGGPE